MILSRRSWHFFIHRLTYGDDAKQPNNLCPYFWKVMFGFFFLLVFLPLAVPVILFRWVCLLFGEEWEAPESIFEEGLCSVYFGMIIIADMIILVVYSMVVMWWTPFPKDKQGNLDAGWQHIFGGIGWMILIGIGIYQLVSYIKKARLKKKLSLLQQNNYRARESSNIFVEVIRAWYKRNCPMIKWK